MKRFNICAILAGIVIGVSHTANAAYPAAQAVSVNGQQVYLPSSNSRVVKTSMPTQSATTPAAAASTRITGALPRVGSTATAAGRQYYQPADYDRLADSGLYVGLSVGYSASVMGSMHADYINETDAAFAPGAFKDADFKTDTVIPLQLSVGASINNDIRVDFSYLRYSNISYPNTIESSNGSGGYVQAQVDGGAITANATMLNLYYNIDSYTGYLAGGSLRPYIGAGVGLSLNTISDYVAYDNTFYEIAPTDSNGNVIADAGQLTGVSDVYAYHNGGTTEQLAFMLEGGLTTEMDGGIKLDFFARYTNLGRVKTSGSIVVLQTEWLADGNGGEYEAPYDTVFHYTNWYESGRLSMVDVGVRLRLQF